MTRFADAAAILALTAVPAVIVTVQPQATAHADSCADAVGNRSLPLDAGVCAVVLAQEARWLKAITDGDRETVESILSPNYRHITSDGVLLDRDAELAGTTPLLLTMTPTDQIVDIAGDTAVIHGVNTLTNATGVLESGAVHGCVRAAGRHLDGAFSAGKRDRLASPANLPQT